MDEYPTALVEVNNSEAEALYPGSCHGKYSLSRNGVGFRYGVDQNNCLWAQDKRYSYVYKWHFNGFWHWVYVIPPIDDPLKQLF